MVQIIDHIQQTKKHLAAYSVYLLYGFKRQVFIIIYSGLARVCNDKQDDMTSEITIKVTIFIAFYECNRPLFDEEEPILCSDTV